MARRRLTVSAQARTGHSDGSPDLCMVERDGDGVSEVKLAVKVRAFCSVFEETDVLERDGAGLAVGRAS
eukprot:10804151-Ditylum_brightwellii.AAC.1